MSLCTLSWCYRSINNIPFSFSMPYFKMNQTPPTVLCVYYLCFTVASLIRLIVFAFISDPINIVWLIPTYCSTEKALSSESISLA